MRSVALAAMAALAACGPAPVDPPADPPSTGTIRGAVRYTGRVPAETRITFEADPYCAGIHKEPVMTEFYKIGADGGVANVFVYVTKGLGGRKYDPPAEAVVLDQVGCAYVPRVMGVMVGQALAIRNGDETMHNIHAFAKANPEFNFSQARRGEEDTKRFWLPEVMVSVKCDVHPWMICHIGVVTHPFFAVTGADGAYEIRGLPPGEYEIGAWHEKLGRLSGAVRVPAGGGTAVLDLAFRGD